MSGRGLLVLPVWFLLLLLLFLSPKCRGAGTAGVEPVAAGFRNDRCLGNRVGSDAPFGPRGVGAVMFGRALFRGGNRGGQTAFLMLIALPATSTLHWYLRRKVEDDSPLPEHIG